LVCGSKKYHFVMARVYTHEYINATVYHAQVTLYDRTDKLENGYLPTYLDIAHTLGPAADVAELGVQRGGSLELWQVLFPNGRIYGVDIDPEATYPPGTIPLTMDQVDADLPAYLPHRLDLIIDDASHEAGPTRRSFELLFQLLNPGGFYVIEDWGVAFPGNAPMHDPDFLPDLLGLLDTIRGDNRVESITFRTGLIIIRRK
jgi:SAM-dependent methyltransferase